MSRLRAKLAKEPAKGYWCVTLWSHDPRGVPFYFGSRRFNGWSEALSWMLWRLDLGPFRG